MCSNSFPACLPKVRRGVVSIVFVVLVLVSEADSILLKLTPASYSIIFTQMSFLLKNSGAGGLDKEKYPANMGKAWLDDELLQLLQNVRKKKTHQEIAAEHQRTVGGITSRLREIAVDYHNEGRSMESIQKFTGLDKEVIEDAIKRREISERIREQKKKEKAVQPASKPYIQQKITSFTEAEPTMKELMVILKDIQMKVDFLIERPSY